MLPAHPASTGDDSTIISEGVSPDLQRRFGELVAKRRAETITPDEWHELIQFTDQIEQRDGECLAALAELARLRQMTLVELMDALRIEPSACA